MSVAAPSGSSSARKVIITCAVTGAVHVPSQSPYLPITPEQIAESALGAAEAGAAILHLHARRPENGKPTPDPEMFMHFLPRIAAGTNAVINITTGGGQGMTLDERLAAAMRIQAGDVLAQHGLDELRPLPDGEPDQGVQVRLGRGRPGELPRLHLPQHLRRHRAHPREPGRSYGTRFEFECYDVGHLYNLAHFLDRGLVKPPAVRPDHLRHPRRHRHRSRRPAPHEAHRRPPPRRRLPSGRSSAPAATSSTWSPWARSWAATSASASKTTSTWARASWPTATPSWSPRSCASSRELSLDVATPDEARAMLGLKGKENTAI